MKISILAVGTELLMGKTHNSNSTYLSKEINNLGHSVMCHMAIGDNPGRVKSSLEYLLSVSDMVITTGGLGPTKDDLTKEIIAEVFGQKLVLSDIALENMKSRLKAYIPNIPENNMKQVYIPKGSILMNNLRGTAPGFIASHRGKYVAALPGPPKEMSFMFETDFKDFLKSKSDSVILSEYVNLFGVGESSTAAIIDELIENQSNPSLAIYAQIGQVSVRVTASSDTEENARLLLEPTVSEVSTLLKDYVIGYGETSILDSTIEKIVEKKYTLSLAESFTGGLIACNLLSKPDASDFFDSGYVTYCNESKNRILGVSLDTLNVHGAVSEETCLEMVHGLWVKSGANICLSVTGITEPEGGTEEKPVGLVYIGISIDGVASCKKYNFPGDRGAVRQRAYLWALSTIRAAII